MFGTINETIKRTSMIKVKFNLAIVVSDGMRGIKTTTYSGVIHGSTATLLIVLGVIR